MRGTRKIAKTLRFISIALAVVYKFVADKKYRSGSTDSGRGSDSTTHPCLSSVKLVYSVVIEVFPRHESSSSVMELCCRCLKYVIRCVGVDFQSYLESLVSTLVFTFSKYPHSCFLYLGSCVRGCFFRIVAGQSF